MAKGSIRNRGIDCWQVRYEAPSVGGKRQYRAETVNGKKARAEEVLRLRLSEIDRGAYVEPVKTSLAEFTSRWLRDYAEVNVRPKTVKGYESIIRLYLVPALGHVDIQALRPDHVRTLYSSMLKRGLSPTTISHVARLAHKNLADALRWGLVARNVADGVTPPRIVAKEMATLYVGEIYKLLGAVEGTLYHPLFHLAVHTGLRRSEILALRWSDVSFEAKTLQVARSLHMLRGGSFIFEAPKTTRSRRTISLSAPSVESLRAHRRSQAVIDPERLVFSNHDGSPLKPNSVSTKLVRTAERIGLKLHLHQLRHTMASIMLQNGENVRVVSGRLGHSNAAITLSIYAHVMPGADQAAADLLGEILVDPGALRESPA